MAPGKTHPLLSQNSSNLETVKVGVYENPPKIFIDNNGRPNGIFIDIITSISKKENLTIEYVSSTWSELFEMLEEGKIDILPDMAYSEERNALFYFSMPVLSSWLQVYTTNHVVINRPEDIHRKRVGVLDASSQEGFLKKHLRQEFGIEYSVIAFDNYTQSVTALKNNDIDLIVADRFFYFSDLCDQDILPTGVVLQFSELHFAFSKSANPLLIDLFDRNMASMKNDPDSDYYDAMQKWFVDKKSKIPGYWLLSIYILGTGFVIFLIFTLTLRLKVKAKTKILDQQNKDLLIAIEKAQESDRLKSAFLSNISHEIRTPMNGILGFTDLLLEPDLSSEDREHYIDLVHQSGQRMLNTVNDIIEVSKLVAGSVQINITPTNINNCLQDLLQMFSPEAEKKGLIISLEHLLASGFPDVMTDSQKLNSVLTRLVTNALKFTEQGNVKFGCFINEPNLFFYVSDTGIGIPADRQIAAFKLFEQLDNADTRTFEGAGLGLAISKSYVEMLGGKIWLESELGAGTTFYFSIPLNFAEKND